MDANKKNQVLTLTTAISVGNEWSSMEMRTLRDMRELQVPVVQMAQVLGRTYYGVSSKLAALGLVDQNRNVARTKKIAATVVACPDCWLIHNGDCW